MKLLIKFLILLLLLPLMVFGQHPQSQLVFPDPSFNYNKIDTAFNGETITRIRFRNLRNNSEFYNSFNSNGNFETGFLENGYPVDIWKYYSPDGEIITSLDFDTLKVSYKDVIKIARNRNLDLNEYEIIYCYNYEDPTLPDYPEDDIYKENHWEISKFERFEPYYSQSTGFVINAMSGKIEPYNIEILEQPAYKNGCVNKAKFPGDELALQNFLITNSKNPIDADGKNQVRVSFDVLPEGSIENIETGKANTGDFKREAIRLISIMPKWIPAKHMDDKIKCRQKIVINFR